MQKPRAINKIYKGYGGLTKPKTGGTVGQAIKDCFKKANDMKAAADKKYSVSTRGRCVS